MQGNMRKTNAMYRRFFVWDVVFICLHTAYLISSEYVTYPNEVKIAVSSVAVVISIVRVFLLLNTKK